VSIHSHTVLICPLVVITNNFIGHCRLFNAETPWLLKDFFVECHGINVGIGIAGVGDVQCSMLEVFNRD